MKPVKEGKVREIYDNGDNLIMVATDRISCFDVILKNNVTKKGTVLTQMSKFWFNMTEDILPNHMISTDNRKRLGKLSGKRYGMRHQAAGGPERVRQAPGTDLHSVHKG